MARVIINLQKDRPNKQGLVMARLKVIHGETQYYHKIENVLIDPGLWDDDNKEVLEPHANAALINLKLRAERIKVESVILNMDIKGVGFNRDVLKQILTGNGGLSFYQFWEQVNEGRSGTLDPATVKQIKADLNKLKEFRPSLTFDELTLEFLESYEGWLRDVKGNKVNTIHKAMKNIAYVVNRANKRLNANCRVFDHYKKKREKTIRHVFDLAVLDDLMEKLFTNYFNNKGINDALAVHLLQATTGLRYGDAVKFNSREYISNNCILVKTGKTGEIINVPIHNRLQKLLSFTHYNFEYMALQSANRLLKLVAIGAGIKFNLTTHAAVHSFCTICIELGMSIEVVSKLRGHTDIRTTQIYTHINDKLVQKEMSKWDN